MRAINHAMTGAFIGLSVGKPVIALPAAVASHFLLDAIPHYDSNGKKPTIIRSKKFRYTLYADALLCVLLVILLVSDQPLNWALAAVCAFAAAAPDFIWIRRFRLANQRKNWKPGWFEKWSSDIQWFQRPIGWLVELAWFVAGVVIVAPFLR